MSSNDVFCCCTFRSCYEWNTWGEKWKGLVSRGSQNTLWNRGSPFQHAKNWTWTKQTINLVQVVTWWPSKNSPHSFSCWSSLVGCGMAQDERERKWEIENRTEQNKTPKEHWNVIWIRFCLCPWVQMWNLLKTIVLLVSNFSKWMIVFSLCVCCAYVTHLAESRSKKTCISVTGDRHGHTRVLQLP